MSNTNRKQAQAGAFETRQNGRAMSRLHLFDRWSAAQVRAERALMSSKIARDEGRTSRALAYAKVYARWEHIAKRLAERLDRDLIAAAHAGII